MSVIGYQFDVSVTRYWDIFLFYFYYLSIINNELFIFIVVRQKMKIQAGWYNSDSTAETRNYPITAVIHHLAIL
ncbi:hypothetical protein DN756_07270 [Yersinia pseudotuberculosis]|uniref:Uncharacterized protein n=1 Tax=Yersinia pseudotuberculosis TaxID=633 RepID=A0ABN5R8E0_YERPU|nr:hypothetical protein EGX87_10145 [Yersinia pseudotuberculosis]AYW92585.1 hypothetical protein EGX47_15650 [Yersinia pseudotuberculosis]AYW96808.1 hypothetical protein EGX39_13990 [Yersinia pseudotuberculosis]AYX02057.1 hypothetical protein EGX53_20855 [Yersinia pseudotuberculosis]AZA29814.1 hypothetical protein DN756_07270 [Yersinia pseudotuberculosis]